LQYELITGSSGSYQAPFPSHIPETVTNEQAFPGFATTNLLTPRMSHARLRLPKFNDWQNSSKAHNVAKWNGLAAAEDKACATLSEATQVFITRVLLGAVRAAQSGQELEGLRLFEAQRVAGAQEPPLGMVLGCDLQKQAAKANVEAGLEVIKSEEHYKKKYEGRDEKGQREMSSVEGKYLINVPSMSALSKRKHAPELVVENKKTKDLMEKFMKKTVLDPVGVWPGEGKVQVRKEHIKEAVERQGDGVGVAMKRNPEWGLLSLRQGL